MEVISLKIKIVQESDLLTGSGKMVRLRWAGGQGEMGAEAGCHEETITAYIEELKEIMFGSQHRLVMEA